VNPYDTLIEEAKKYKENWGPIKAGLFDGSITIFLEYAEAYKKRLDKLSWW
jgi:hypothetical protein